MIFFFVLVNDSHTCVHQKYILVENAFEINNKLLVAAKQNDSGIFVSNKTLTKPQYIC